MSPFRTNSPPETTGERNRWWWWPWGVLTGIAIFFAGALTENRIARRPVEPHYCESACSALGIPYNHRFTALIDSMTGRYMGETWSCVCVDGAGATTIHYDGRIEFRPVRPDLELAPRGRNDE